MKKYFALAAIAFAAIAMVSCEKNSGNEGNETEDVKRVVKIQDGYETPGNQWEFTYNEDGTIQSVNETWSMGTEEEGSWPSEFSYDGNTIVMGEYTCTLGDKGYVVTLVKGDKTWTLAYNNDNQLVSMTAGEEVFTNEYDSNGNLVKYTTAEGRSKIQTYDAKSKNWGNTFTTYCESAPVKRWMYETGYFGMASKNLCASTKWEDAESVKTYTYEMDDMGYITKETMLYDGALDWTIWYEWETVTK